MIEVASKVAKLKAGSWYHRMFVLTTTASWGMGGSTVGKRRGLLAYSSRAKSDEGVLFVSALQLAQRYQW